MWIVVSPKATIESATKLANALKTKVYNPYKQEVPYGNQYHYINYGCSTFNRHANSRVVNKPFSVNICIDKHAALLTMSKAGVSVPKFTNKKAEAAKWDVDTVVVCHTKREGRKNEGIEYRHPDELVNAYVYTEYFHHKREYRVVVFKNKVIGIYSKVLDNEGNWDLVKLQMRGFNEIIKDCEDAAIALQIDYVGFDVVANTRKDFRILEANSGPIITDEAIEAFVEVYGK